MTDRERIEQAIAALTVQRVGLGEAVIETSLAALQQQLAGRPVQISPSAMRGERRQVTVMFADISGFTAMSEKLDPEEVRTLINGCFELLGEAIDRYGGHIDKFIGDEIMALFGAPVAHENDPERALRAALDMMDALAEFNHRHADKIPKALALHFGLNTGLAIAGGIGTRQRQDYSVMGDTVNLAARLEDLSEAGEILVGETTYRLTAPLFEFQPLPPVKVKGKDQPVNVFRLLKAKAGLGGQLRGIEGLSSPLIGRDVEVERLKAILIRLEAGHGGVVSITGDAGIGKSRLVHELKLLYAQRGATRWVEGRALSYGENAPYLVAREVLRDHLGLALDLSAAQAKTSLRAAVEQFVPGPSSDEVYPYLAYLLDVPLDEEASRRLKYQAGEALHRQLMSAVQRIVMAAGQQSPLVMVWEDLQWADPSSLHLLESLLAAAQTGVLLLVLVYRRPVSGSRIENFQKAISSVPRLSPAAIELLPLSVEQSHELLDNLLGPDTLPDRVKRLMVAKAEGNPFYLEEVIRSLINSGAIVAGDDGRWQVTGTLSEITLPDTLQGVIMSRVDQLDPDAKRVLQVASVIGRNFSYRILAQVLELIPSK
jgi:class 3 adenylate cyclase